MADGTGSAFEIAVAHFVVDTGRPSVSTLVNMILMQLELAGVVDSQQARSPIDHD